MGKLTFKMGNNTSTRRMKTSTYGWYKVLSHLHISPAFD